MANEPRREVECFSYRGEMVHIEAERVVAQARHGNAPMGRREPWAGARELARIPDTRAAQRRRERDVLVSGADKAERLKDVLEDGQPDLLPAQLIRPTHGALHWMIDAAAAARLRGEYVKRVVETGAHGRSNQ